MTEVLFYHLEADRIERVLPGLLEKTLERGWRAIVRCASAETAARLDEWLWTYAEGSFLPHGIAGADDAEQPIVLVCDDDRPHDGDVLFLVEGVAADPARMRAFTRCVVIFDGLDEAALGEARAAWKAVRNAGLPSTYWKKSESGRWEKQG